jgi:hypothetical protein
MSPAAIHAGLYEATLPACNISHSETSGAMGISAL